jgi:integrase/recombinase XerD
MNKQQFWGIYAPYIMQFIDLKRSLGFKYNSEERIYSHFDRFTMELGETQIGISKELSEKWCERKNNESTSTRFHRCLCLSQLSSYLCNMGIPSYIPPLPRNQSTFVPYIFSKPEMTAIFCAADGLRAKRRTMNSMMFIMPALLRLLYSTGLRISEALELRNKDVDMTDCYMVIKDSKNGKQRMLPFSDSLSVVLKDYINHRNQLPVSNSKNDYFFTSLNGSRCSQDAVYKWFRDILKFAKIPFTGHHHGPRVHDLRHTFAVTSLARMAETGVDLYSKLPILSTYLGHQSFNATNSYVRLTAEMYPSLLKSADLVCLNVFPDLTSYEDN